MNQSFYGKSCLRIRTEFGIAFPCHPSHPSDCSLAHREFHHEFDEMPSPLTAGSVQLRREGRLVPRRGRGEEKGLECLKKKPSTAMNTNPPQARDEQHHLLPEDPRGRRPGAPQAPRHHFLHRFESPAMDGENTAHGNVNEISKSSRA